MISVPILRRKHLWKFYATPWLTGSAVLRVTDDDISQIGLPEMSELITSPGEVIDEIAKNGSVDDDVDWQPNRDRIVETEDQAAEFARRYQREVEKDEKTGPTTPSSAAR